MVQLVCPLCGRFVSLDYFNPGSFDSDIFGVVTRGLGRGKGTMVVDRFSVLDVPEIVTPIKNRCLHLIGIIDGKSTPRARGPTIVTVWIFPDVNHEDGEQIQINVLYNGK